MKYLDRELAELQVLYATVLSGRELCLTECGEIDLTKVVTGALSVAQARALGSMLDEVLSALKPVPKRKAPARR